MVHKTYPARVIVGAINNYNLGHSLESAARAINRRFRISVSKNSVDNWVKETLDVCTYYKLRGKIDKDYEKLITGRIFEHKNKKGDSSNLYEFQYHKAKLDYLCTHVFEPLKQYVERFERDGCPDFFDKIPNRCSATAVKVRVRKKDFRNNACRLAELALLPCRNNKRRHPMVQEFMLINDSSTIAVELPVWLHDKGLDMNMSGHIDVVQVRRGRIFVLDYKPEAARQNENKVVSQLYWYATGLSFRTRIPLRLFRCAWFDDNMYFEFDPSEVEILE